MYFLDYLLCQFSNYNNSFYGASSKPDYNTFTTVIDKDRLTTYWKSNNKQIKDQKFENIGKIFI